MSKLSEKFERLDAVNDPTHAAFLCVNYRDEILAALRAHETGASGAVPWREMVTLADFESDPHGYETTRYEAMELALKSVPNFADATRAAERMRERAALVLDREADDQSTSTDEWHQKMARMLRKLAAAIRALPTDGE